MPAHGTVFDLRGDERVRSAVLFHLAKTGCMPTGAEMRAILHEMGMTEASLGQSTNLVRHLKNDTDFQKAASDIGARVGKARDYRLNGAARKAMEGDE